MALENDDLIIVQKGDGSHAKATIEGFASSIDLSEYAKLVDPEQEIEAKRFLGGDDIRANQDDPTTVGVEVNGGLGIVHLKPKNNQVTPLEIFGPGSVVQNQSSSIFRVTPGGEIHINHDAIALKSDGSGTFAKQITATEGYALAQLQELP